MAVLVSGGAGYIGSHTVLKLIEANRDVVIADDFSNASPKVVERLNLLSKTEIPVERVNLCDRTATEAIFQKYPIDSVIHFAGFKSVGESVSKPLEYFHNNLISTLNLLEIMRDHGVRNFVFSSSATVYGDPEHVPITEDMPLHVTNPYGRTKLMIEDMLRDLSFADSSFNIALLRYFNPVGAHASSLIGEDPSGIPNNLVPYIAKVAVGKLHELPVYGNDYPTRDGTGVRDYVHVEDLAAGHLCALKKLETNCGLVTYNLGTGQGYTVLEIVAAYEKASGKPIPYKIMPRRPGDIAACYADVSLAKKELGWSATLTLDDMCRDSWNWQTNNPDGYK